MTNLRKSVLSFPYPRSTAKVNRTYDTPEGVDLSSGSFVSRPVNVQMFIAFSPFSFFLCDMCLLFLPLRQMAKAVRIALLSVLKVFAHLLSLFFCVVHIYKNKQKRHLHKKAEECLSLLTYVCSSRSGGYNNPAIDSKKNRWLKHII